MQDTVKSLLPVKTDQGHMHMVVLNVLDCITNKCKASKDTTSLIRVALNLLASTLARFL